MDFQALTDYLDALPAKGVPGCDLIICRAHETLYRHFSGEREQGVPMDGTENYWLYSATKPITMTAVMQLVEQGKIHLSDPVSNYLPAYAELSVRDGKTLRPARTVMTIEHLMTMQGGLDYNLNRPAIRACLDKHKESVTMIELAEAFVADGLIFDPGTNYNYSLCHDVLAVVIEVVTGLPFAQYVQENIFDPLGICHMTFDPTPAHLAQLAARYRWNEQEEPVEIDRYGLSFRLAPGHYSGGAGLMGNVEEYALFTDALANDGVGKTGKRILTADSIRDMQKNRLHGVSLEEWYKNMTRKGYGYGLGVRTLIDRSCSRSPLGEFGWDGAAGAYVMIDPVNQLSVFYDQHVMECLKSYFVFHPTIRDMIYEELGL